MVSTIQTDRPKELQFSEFVNILEGKSESRLLSATTAETVVRGKMVEAGQSIENPIPYEVSFDPNLSGESLHQLMMDYWRNQEAEGLKFEYDQSSDSGWMMGIFTSLLPSADRCLVLYPASDADWRQ